MKRPLIVATALIALVGGLTACSSSGGGSSSQPPGSAAAGSSSAGGGSTSLASCVSDASKVVTESETAPRLEVAAIKGGTSSLKGKSIWLVVDTTYPLLAEQASGIKAAAAAVGAKVTVFNDHSSTTDENQGLQEAVGAKANLIIIDAIQTALVQNSLTKAHAAGIPVVSIYEKATSAAAQAAVKATIFLDGHITGKDIAAYALKETGCKLNAGVIYSSVFTEEEDALAGIRSYIAQECPKTCTITTKQFQPATESTTVGPTVVSFASSNPDANALLLTLDTLADYAVPALKASHKNFLVVGEGGAPEDEQRVATKTDMLKADVANSSNALVGWTTADAAFRVLLGQPLIADDTFLTRMLDVSNIPASADDYFPYTKNFETQFKTAWGVSA